VNSRQKYSKRRTTKRENEEGKEKRAMDRPKASGMKTGEERIEERVREKQ